jgi:hypothetical protein
MPFLGTLFKPRNGKRRSPSSSKDGCPAKFLPTPISKTANNGTVYARDVGKFGVLPDTLYREHEKLCKKTELFLTPPKNQEKRMTMRIIAPDTRDP